MVRPKDQFWDHVEERAESFKCKFCEFKFAAGTSISRIKLHLSGVEGHGTNICTKAPDGVKEAAYLAVQGANKRLKIMPSSSHREIINTMSDSSRGQIIEVETEERDAERMEMDVRSMEREMGNQLGLTVSAHETIRDAFPAPNDLVSQVIQKDWHEITSWLMNMDLELIQPEGLEPNVAETRGDCFLTTNVVGKAFRRSMDAIWSCLWKENVLRIGIYGMGGVGKTALMKRIHNKLLERPDAFCHVYWITVSQDFSICKLQSSVAKAIHLDLYEEEDEDKRAAQLSKALISKQKCVLILDDLWNHFPLEKVGITDRVNGCKLLLTTRSLEVCRRMGCQEKTKVVPLTDEESWTLFLEKLGCHAPLPSEIQEIAKSVARECAGLPLGIITMAGSMREVADVREWRNVLEELRESKVRQDDMEPEVFRILRFSYMRLNDSALKQCFLYCALFPEDFQIHRGDVIGYLIDDGIIGRMKSRKAEFDKGHTMLNKLENLCLLERFNYHVKMHDLIRDMALQLLSVRPQAMIKAGAQLTELPHEEKWTKDLVKVSLMQNRIKEIPSNHSSKCPNLSVLFLCRNFELRLIADNFFSQFPGLKILDLSITAIQRVPASVSDLVNLVSLLLRGCTNLTHVPSLAKLKALKKLDLRGTRIEDVPQGIELLSDLMYLDLFETRVKGFSAGILTKLSHLQFLGFAWSSETPMKVREEVDCLRKLETLNCLFYDICDFNRYLRSQKQCSQSLLMDAGKENQSLSEYKFQIGKSGGRKMDTGDYYSLRHNRRCKKVFLYSCFIGVKGEFLQLQNDTQELVIVDCHNVRSLCDVSLLRYGKDLKYFHVEGCDGMKFLLPFFPDILESLEILRLQRLKSLCVLISREGAASPLFPPNGIFSCLKEIGICSCHSLKNLFPSGLLPSLQHLQVISVEDCSLMEEIIAVEEESSSFCLPKLQLLQLRNLAELKSIYVRVITCCSLRKIRIVGCMKLKRIPLSLPLPRLEEILAYPKQWWELVDWDHPNAKNVLQPLCRFRRY